MCAVCSECSVKCVHATGKSFFAHLFNLPKFGCSLYLRAQLARFVVKNAG